MVRVLSSGAAGVSAGALIASLGPAWPILLLLIASLAATAVSLAAIQVLADKWSSFYPNAARRVANPRRWFPSGKFAASDPESDPVEAVADTTTPPNGGEFADIAPLTPDEILNLDHHDIDMVRSISRMDDRDAQDIMVPTLDVDSIAVGSSLEEVIQTFASSRHTRLPVYRDTMDDVVGILHISDILPELDADRTVTQWENWMRTPEFVAETMPVDDLLHLMRSQSLQMVIVVDEYGGVEGLVTLEDVLEEIVGEIDDEFAVADADAPAADADGSWLVGATVPVEEVNRIVGLQLDDHDVNTIGGYVYTELGRMPTTGDVIDTDEVSIEVVQVRGRRIQQLRLIPLAVDISRGGLKTPIR